MFCVDNNMYLVRHLSEMCIVPDGHDIIHCFYRDAIGQLVARIPWLERFSYNHIYNVDTITIKLKHTLEESLRARLVCASVHCLRLSM